MIAVKEDLKEPKENIKLNTENTCSVNTFNPDSDNSSTQDKYERESDKENINNSSEISSITTEDINKEELLNTACNISPTLTHLERILRHSKSPDQKQKLLELYNLIVTQSLPKLLIEINELDKPLTQPQRQQITELKNKFKFMPQRFFELSLCKRLPPLYYMIPKEDLYNIDLPKSAIIKRRKIKPCTLNIKKYVNKKEYKCTIDDCKKTYTSAYGLKYHEERGHIIETPNSSTKEYIFRCKIYGCKKSYKQKNGLRYHLKKCHNINIAEYNSNPLTETTQSEGHSESTIQERIHSSGTEANENS